MVGMSMQMRPRPVLETVHISSHVAPTTPHLTRACNEACLAFLHLHSRLGSSFIWGPSRSFSSLRSPSSFVGFVVIIVVPGQE